MPIVIILVILVLAASMALAQTPAAIKTPFDMAAMLTYLWIGGWGMVGGLVSFYQRVKRGDAKWVNLNELIGEVFTSGFVGVVTGMLCQAMDAPQTLTFALAGLTGHMGGRAIFWLERLMQKFAEKKLGVTVDKPKE